MCRPWTSAELFTWRTKTYLLSNHLGDIRVGMSQGANCNARCQVQESPILQVPEVASLALDESRRWPHIRRHHVGGPFFQETRCRGVGPWIGHW